MLKACLKDPYCFYDGQTNSLNEAYTPEFENYHTVEKIMRLYQQCQFLLHVKYSDACGYTPLQIRLFIVSVCTKFFQNLSVY